MPHIVVPLDGSDLARRAVPIAAALAHATGADLRLVQAAVSPTSLEVGLAVEMILEAATVSVEAEAAAIKATYGLEATTQGVIAFADRLILLEAGDPEAMAIVMSTHGRTGLLRLARGSVAETVLRHSPIPVYLVPAAAGAVAAEPRFRHILVPLDGSALSYSVLAPVTELAKAAHARVTLMRVFADAEELARAPDQPALRAVEQQLDRLEDKAHEYFRPIKANLRRAGIKADSEWTTGVPAQEILTWIELMQPDLIALATHGRSGFDRLRYGSVTESVLRQAKVPVLTFGPQALRRLAADVGALVDAKLASAGSLG